MSMQSPSLKVTVFLRIAPAILCLTLAYAWAHSVKDTTTVELRLIDTARREVTPAMVCIREAGEGTVRLPPDGKICGPPSTTAQFTGGVRFEKDRNWVGPVRKTLGKGDNRDRSYVYELRPSLPYWSEPVMYQTSGNFSIELPKGRWRIAVSHGMEYVPVVEEFETSGGGSLERTLELRRWIDLPTKGWISGDVHVHHPTVEETQREFLLQYARAEDVHLVNILEQIHHGGRHSPQAGFGAKFRVQRGDTWLISGQEAPSSTFGHIMGLNVDRLIHDPENVDFYDLAFRRIHEKKEALVGYAHFSWRGCDLPRGFPWYVTTGGVDFVELLQFAQLNAMDYHDYLNLGFRLTAAAGSDVPWGSTIGEVRTYAYTGATFDPDRWFEALKKGHTFVTNGPALDFTVDGRLPGSEIPKAAGSTVRAVVKAQSHPRIGRLKRLVLAGNEGVLKEVTSDRPQNELGLDLEVSVPRSRWLAASAECENGALAHTTPVYAIVEDQPAWCPERGPRLIDKQLEAIRNIEREFAGRTDARSRGILERIEKAEKFYADLKEKIERSREKGK